MSESGSSRSLMRRRAHGAKAIHGGAIQPCPLLPLNGHPRCLGECPLSGVKRTSLALSQMSAFDPKRTSARGRGLCLNHKDQWAGTAGLPIVSLRNEAHKASTTRRSFSRTSSARGPSAGLSTADIDATGSTAATSKSLPDC